MASFLAVDNPRDKKCIFLKFQVQDAVREINIMMSQVICAHIKGLGFKDCIIADRSGSLTQVRDDDVGKINRMAQTGPIGRLTSRLTDFFDGKSKDTFVIIYVGERGKKIPKGVDRITTLFKSMFKKFEDAYTFEICS